MEIVVSLRREMVKSRSALLSEPSRGLDMPRGCKAETNDMEIQAGYVIPLVAR
jgi:hypothetical protein